MMILLLYRYVKQFVVKGTLKKNQVTQTILQLQGDILIEIL